MFELNYKAKPFLKWAGGKGQLLPQLEMALPYELYDNPFTYIEPFVGGGAMLFFMLQKFPNIKRVVINDINSNLTGAYQSIKDNPKGLICQLKSIEKQYLPIMDYEEQKSLAIFCGMISNNVLWMLSNSDYSAKNPDNTMK